MELSTEEAVEAKEVLGVLNEGGSVRYFAVAGWQAVHNKDGEPFPTQKCSVTVFLHLREKGLIDMSERNVMGYPYYADNHRSDVYRITKAGRKFLKRK